MEIKKYLQEKLRIHKLVSKDIKNFEKGDFSKSKGINKAIEILDNLLKKSPTDTTLLIKKAVLVQLSDENCKYSLKDVKSLLKLATKIDKNNIEALIELAYYYYTIENRNSKAYPLIEKGFDLCINNIKELLELKIKCLIDQDKKDKIKKEITELKLKIRKGLKEAFKKGME